ncbi:MAG: S41 family peptidase [Deinococcales bacterium]
MDYIRSLYGDLPCLGVFAQDTSSLTEFSELGKIRYQLIGKHGYIILPDLASAFVPSHLRSAIEELITAGAEDFILDLRGNPGGRLVEMMQWQGTFTGSFST